MSVFWEQLCSRLNVRLRHLSAFHTQTNGQTQRKNGTIKQLLRVAEYQDRNWLGVLDIVEIAVNNAPFVETETETFYHDLPEFTGAEKRIKEQPCQFLAHILADWNHVSEIIRKNQDRCVQRSNKQNTT